jgi:hypothetical protein
MRLARRLRGLPHEERRNDRMLETMETTKLGHEAIEGFEGDLKDRCGEVSRLSRECRDVGSVGIQVNRSLGQ